MSQSIAGVSRNWCGRIAACAVALTFGLDARLAPAQSREWVELCPLARERVGAVYDTDAKAPLFIAGDSPNASFNGLWQWNGSDLVARKMTVSYTAPWYAFDSGRHTLLTFRLGAALLYAYEFEGTRWIETPTDISNRTAWSTVYDSARSVMMLFGGENTTGPLNETWERNGTTWTLRTPADGVVPPARSNAALVFDPGQARTLLFGGNSGTQTRSDLWSWNGTAWKLLAPDNSGPSDRRNAGVAFDSARNVLIVCGGQTPSGMILNDVWEWNGLAWTARDPSPMGPRCSAGVVYDPVQRVTVFFGGRSQQSPVVVESDIWTYDGNSWRKFGTRPPPKRDGHSLVFDPVRHETVMFGGIDDRGYRYDETWTYANRQWMQRIPADGVHPQARINHSAVFDSERGVMILFGGTDPWTNKPLGDTWEWNGVTWRQLSETGPSPRTKHSMAYDPIHRRTVLTGGIGAGDKNLTDTWEWNGTTWTLRAVGGYPFYGFKMPFVYDEDHQTLFLNHSPIVVNTTYRGANSVWDGSSWRLLVTGKVSFVSDTPAAFDPDRGEILATCGIRGGSPDGASRLWNGADWIKQSFVFPFGSIRTFSAVAYDTDRSVFVLFGGSASGRTYTTTAELVSDLWIPKHPQGGEACPGRPFDLRVTGVGHAPITFQWRKDGSLIPGATGKTLHLPAVDASDAGTYDCVVSDTTGGIISNPATITLRPCPYGPCAADYNGSGGSPDADDIAAFFADWLDSTDCADTDCSGGTPDVTDIDAFFSEWLAGGC